MPTYRHELFIPAAPGEGVVFTDGGLPKGVRERIEELGRLNDDRIRYEGTCSWMGLFKLAAKYRRKAMPMMALNIKIEAKELRDVGNIYKIGQMESHCPVGRATDIHAAW